MEFTSVTTEGAKGGVRIPVPFDPDEIWGRKPHHDVAGTVNGMGMRASLTPGAGQSFALGPAWCRPCGMDAGRTVTVVVFPEGPQRGALDPDIDAALSAEPDAAWFFDGLAQFYKNAYLAWIAATKRSPAERAHRIATTVALLKAGQRERPRP